MGGLDVLWQPIEVGGLTLANRILMTAHSPLYGPDAYAAYLRERARGGPGLIVTGAVSVHRSAATPTGGGYPNAWDRGAVDAFRLFSSTVHELGGTLFCQIYHNGHHHAGTHSLADWHALVGPSAIASPVVGVVPKALELDEIAEIVTSFADAAELARLGGMDGVEVHAAHGYLLQEFLSPLTNRRTDEYGGPAGNRARIVLEIAQAIRGRCGSDYPIGLKMAYDELVGESGLTPETAAENLRVLHAAGLFDYVSISSGNYHTIHHLIAPMTSELSGHYADHSALAKKVVGALPVMVTGGIKTLEMAAEIVASGKSDMVGMTRAFIADPELVTKARDGRGGEIRRCVGANQGCWRRLVSGQEITCSVNPIAGRERVWGAERIGRADKLRSVLVVGGGPAGMKAAEAAAQRGHRVTLVEKEPELGGQLRFAARLPHRASWWHLVEDLAGSLRRLGVDVRLGTEATPDTPGELGADTTIVAAGATYERSGFSILRPDRDTIPGAESGHVLTPIEAITDLDACGDRVLVLDDVGDYTPLGLAELIAQSGRSVRIVTILPAVGLKVMLATTDFPWTYPRLVAAGVHVLTQSTVDLIEPTTVTVADIWSGKTTRLPADSVVLAMGRRSEDTLYLSLRDRGVSVVRIGDCVAPREVDDATFEGVRSGLAA
jgi:2,4-dienoyl-CoA reductase-like NADH-dependent reductase (Old Yellow Enzyme family)